MALVSLATGAVPISPRTILSAMLGHHPLTETQRLILFHIRLPRVLASGLVGSGLALAGLLFQGLFRNPIADPYVIGSSGGAVFGACIGIFFFSQWSIFGFSATALLAFAGSAATMALVYALARSAGKTNVVTLLLAGFAISTMFTNSSYFFELFDKTRRQQPHSAFLAARRNRHTGLDRIRSKCRFCCRGNCGCAFP